MKISSYVNHNLVEIDKAINAPLKNVTIDGKSLTIQELLSVSQHGSSVILTTKKSILKQIEECYRHMMLDVENGVPIYGCNTGYGARAEIVVNQGNKKTRMKMAKSISESILHTDVSVGPLLPTDITRGAMLIRINMLMNGVSAVRLKDLEIYQKTLNKHITPIVNAYGGLGASGDLAHNCRIVSTLRRLPGTRVINAKGIVCDATKTLQQANIPKLELEPKAGLGLVNGDNFSTSAAAIIVNEVIKYTIIADVVGAMVVEVLKGSNRTFHPFLSAVRPYNGQRELAAVYRYLLEDSKLAYQELKGQQQRDPGVNIQDVYSLRCITQSEGFNREQLAWALDTITINANSVSDNPLWVTPSHTTPGEKPWQWVSGGNFFAMHMAEVLDSMRKIITRLIKRNDRHLHRLVSPQTNNGLPANLSDSSAISQCTFKGVQLQSGMFDVYSIILAQPVTILFGIHEESNQDITPHSLTSAILALQNLELLRYSLSMNLLAVAQAVDLRGGAQLLSPKTRPVYEYIRDKCAYITKERPIAPDIETISSSILTNELSAMLRAKVFHTFVYESKKQS